MADFEKMYAGAYYTITGCGGDINDWKNGYQKWLDEDGIGTVKEWVEFTGEEMNNYYHLTGSNAYKNDLKFLSFPLDNLDEEKLEIFRLENGDRLFDDIVDKNRLWEEDS